MSAVLLASDFAIPSPIWVWVIRHRRRNPSGDGWVDARATVAPPSLGGMTPDLPARRLLLVHAHPDDESIATGITMAKYASEGAGVTLVTCTLGEEGEVLIDSLGYLAAAREDGLGQHRIGELEAAMKELGVTDHRFLGGPGHYRDTGMADSPNGGAMVPEQVRPDSFWAADLREAADLLVSIIREVRPQVLVTYDEFGALRSPRPRAGPPGGHVRVAAGRHPVVPARPRRAVAGAEDLLERHGREPAPGQHPSAARGRRHHDLRGDGPGRPTALVRHARRAR